MLCCRGGQRTGGVLNEVRNQMETNRAARTQAAQQRPALRMQYEVQNASHSGLSQQRYLHLSYVLLPLHQHRRNT